MRLEDLKPEPVEPVLEADLITGPFPDIIVDEADFRRRHASIVENFKNAHRFFFTVDPDGTCKKIPIGRARTPNVWGD